MSRIINGKKLARRRQQKLAEKIAGLGFSPQVVSILVGNDPPSVLYTKVKQKKAKELGISFRPLKFKESARFQEVKEALKKLNEDQSLTGIMVQLPLPEKFLGKHETAELLFLIDPKKDIDGLGGRGDYLSATAKAVLSIVEDEEIEVAGKNVTVLGASDLVGKPIAKGLTKMGANVTVCTRRTANLRKKIFTADILVSATGVPGLVTGEMVPSGSVVIDVGSERVEGKVVGDVDFKSVYPKASKITPVPGGVGPMTVVSLMENIVDAGLRQSLASHP